LSVDVVKEIMKRLSMPQEIKAWPWVRGYKAATEGPNVVLFPTARTPTREPLFQWVGPLAASRYCLYARKGSGISIHSLDDARKLKAIGTYRENYAAQYLIQQGFTNLEYVVDNKLNIKKLMGGHLDAITAISFTISDIMKEAGYSRDDVEEVFLIRQSESYIAFSKQVPPEVVQAWQHAYDEIRDEGLLLQIQHKWMPEEYPLKESSTRPVRSPAGTSEPMR
jgi:polar amino acid transport system substrate-binding protein